MVYKIFGELNDDKKDANLSLRVSKETRNLFEQHAKGKYGDNATALKDILLRYMETIAYKRGTINSNAMYIIVPKIKKMENIVRDYKTQFVIHDTNQPLEYFPPNELKYSVSPFDIYDYGKDYLNFDEYGSQILFHQAAAMGYGENDFIVVFFYLNNLLDIFNEGIYSIGPNNPNGHMGFIMFEFQDVVYHVILTYVLDDDGVMTMGNAEIKYGLEAYKFAKNKDNLELAKFIDSYNPNTSNIEQDITALKNKREDLERQIQEINAQIKKLKK
ncbi:hypothetical protein [Methanobrevibacter sp.]|uniref:hypothetical protein n=1 Tax=Methanobrevibacter sp. TaxID=66852 RepID=UPI003863EBCB